MTTSYFSQPAATLDPVLFDHGRLRDGIRVQVLAPLLDWLHQRFRSADLWVEAWLAGSGVSFQWQAARQPADLDCLVGVHFEIFREHNQNYAGLSDNEVAALINDDLWTTLVPTTAQFLDQYELTYYCNAAGTDIMALRPYAAYDLRHDTWTVMPLSSSPVNVAEWDTRADCDHERALTIVRRYNNLLASVQNATNPAHRTNTEVYLQHVLEDASTLYQQIHEGRGADFSRTGFGYLGPGNYRWQAGKERGTINALKTLHDFREQQQEDDQLAAYGVALPDSRTLLLRAAVWED